MACGVDSSADRSSGSLLGITDRPKLLEGLDTIDTELIYSGSLENIVRRSVAGNRTSLRGGGGRVIRAVCFDDIVLNERAAGPTVDGQVAIASRLEGTRVADDSRATSGVPSLSTNKFTVAVGPGDGVLAAGPISEVSLSSTIRPQVVAGERRINSRPRHKLEALRHLRWSSIDASDGSNGNKERI